MLYAIYYAGKPIRLDTLMKLELNRNYAYEFPESKRYLVMGSVRDTIKLYNHYIGYTWSERHTGISVGALHTLEKINAEDTHKPRK